MNICILTTVVALAYETFPRLELVRYKIFGLRPGLLILSMKFFNLNLVATSKIREAFV
jgi:hypothetical protein